MNKIWKCIFPLANFLLLSKNSNQSLASKERLQDYWAFGPSEGNQGRLGRTRSGLRTLPRRNWRLVFSTFSLCSQMPIVFYHGVIYGLGFFILTNRFHVAVRLFSNRSQMTSKCGKNKKVAHKAIAECVTDVLTTFWRLLWSITESDARQHGIYLFYIITKSHFFIFQYNAKAGLLPRLCTKKAIWRDLWYTKWHNFIGCYA